MVAAFQFPDTLLNLEPKLPSGPLPIPHFPTPFTIRTMSDLTPRKEQILRAVIVEYITAAEPVASELIAQKYELGVRSATVRSELAEITDLGLLEQPHTSAGRIPSDRGYRYYVDRLIVETPVGAESQDKLQEATEEDTLRQMLRGTTRTLSRLTHLLSAAATVRDTRIRVRNGILTALGPQKGLIVLVLENGHVENRMVDCPAGLTLQHIGQVNEILSKLLENSTVGQLAKVKPPTVDDTVLAKILKSVFAALRATARDITRGQLITEGEEYILSQPEFQRSAGGLSALLASIEDDEAMHAAVIGDGVTIGRENPIEKMQGLSILRKTFYVGSEEAGTIAIVGPTRLQYDRAISLLDFTAHAVSETLTKLMK